MLTAEETIILQNLLISDEELRQFPYLDCCGKPWRECTCLAKGKLTIGVGRNLDDVGISESECLILLDNNMRSSTIEVEKAFVWFRKLNSPRKIVIVSMAFNMGIAGLKQFQKMITSIESGDFSGAAKQMLNSKWATQVGKRAIRLAVIMKTGFF